jgi:uncharacterized damage-inducible protein DinB
MTIDTVKLFAEYNNHSNNEMNKYISLLNHDEWEKEFDGFFKSIGSLCTHIYIADFTWLKRFGLLRQFKFLNNKAFQNNYSRDSKPFNNTDEYIIKRNELDSIINSFSEEIVQNDLGEHIKYKNWKNEDQNRNFGGLVIHFFNHQTHHRGMISLYLEFLGRENDFSNLLLLV